ncbi:MAG TPA: hypothetical protein VL793_16800, partial [Patescibacteria group bacterium]|nr:hypothetical protein [Patescibacteria group bacterium]
DSLRQNKLEAAEDFSRKLIHLSGVTLDDRLLRLTILQRLSATGAVQAVTLKNSNGPEFENFLTAVQAQSISNSTAIYSVCQWMGSHGMASQALDWVSALDRSTRATQPVPLAVANLYVAKNDSAALQSFLERENWNDLEFFRLALLARSEWGRNERASGDARWASALRSAGDRLGALIVMTGLADEWGRDPEDILWQIARRFPAEHWALEQLEDRYTASANTRGLNLVYASRLAERRLPLDFTNRNNFASSSLLLGVNLPEAHSIARELYLVRSNDVVIASTYAYSLHLLGKTRDGLNVLARFKPEQLETPAIALYYGTLLCATGDGQQARPYLHAAAKARLLPEETQLLQAAIKSEQARR